MSFYTDNQYKISTRRHDQLIHRIYLDDLGEDRPGPQLDVGCSIGNFVALDPGRLEGGDIDRDALAVCRERGLPCRYLDVTEERSLEPCHYEVIYLRHVIEHMDDPLVVMRRLYAALRPGGLCVVETPDYIMAHHRRRKNFWDDYTHKRPFTPRSLERVGYDAGFKVKRWMHLPELGRLSRLLLRRNILGLEALARWKSRLRMGGSDLAFVFEKLER